MKLYYSPGACSLSPHIVIRELGLPVQLVKVDLKTKTAEDGDYLAVNPKGYVPALKLEDGHVLTEGPVIVQYLADQAPPGAPRLAPPYGTRERYELMAWLNFLSTEIHKAFSPLFWPMASEETRRLFRERLARWFDDLAARVTDRDYLLGADFSVADAYLFTLLGWCAPCGIELGRWPALERYRTRIAARPAVREALLAEGLIPA